MGGWDIRPEVLDLMAELAAEESDEEKAGSGFRPVPRVSLQTARRPTWNGS